MTYREKFEDFLNEIEQMEKDNKTLNEQLLALEKTIEEGLKKFNTETHILVEIGFLEGISGLAQDTVDDTEQSAQELSYAEGNCQEAGYSADNAGSNARRIWKDVDKLLDERQ